METLLLKFSGPLQSWGTGSHFETRHTDLYPSKSGVIGLLAACLGYKRNDDKRMQSLNRLHFAVRIDQAGTISRDYQTAHAYEPKPRTYVTNRYYLEDAVFVIAIGHEDEDWVVQIEEGLTHPYFQPFLGRRSAVPLYDFILKKTNKDVLSSLKEEAWQAAEWYKRRFSDTTDKLTIYMDSDLMPSLPTTLRKDHVVSFDTRGREYVYRTEVKTYMDLPRLQIDHDAFAALGG